MDFLTLFVVVPVLTILGIVFTKNMKQTRMISAIGMGIQLFLAVAMVFMYLAERKAGNTAEMLFSHSYLWFPSLNIHYNIGVDGISVAMIMLTAIVVFTGIFASWNVEFPFPRIFYLADLSFYRGFWIFYFHRLVYHVPFLRSGCYPHVFTDWYLGNRTERIFGHETDTDADGSVSLAACGYFRHLLQLECRRWRHLRLTSLKLAK